MAARTCAVPAPRISCNGAMSSGRSSGRRDRRALDECRREHRNSGCAVSEPRNCVPNPSAACEAVSGHLPVTIMREPDFIMSVPRILTALVASVLMCGGTHLAQAQSAAPKASKGAAAKPAPSKPEAAARPEAKPTAAVAGNAEPTLIGQFGTWGAYT